MPFEKKNEYIDKKGNREEQFPHDSVQLYLPVPFLQVSGDYELCCTYVVQFEMQFDLIRNYPVGTGFQKISNV